jgi:branched-subunit amino acid aminotransferase/4-amino-4-deoxychorismate lyase
VRRTPSGAVDATVKNFQWGDLIRALFEAYDRGAWLPILTDGDGKITEGPGFNVFVVKDDRIHTPARGVLLGITRRTAIEIAEHEGFTVEVDDLPTSLVYEADEIFLTTTAGGIIPVRHLDGEPVGTSAPGPITTRIRETYWAWHDDPRFCTVVSYTD